MTSVPGRLERVNNSSGIHIFIDHAHKPAALKAVLQALQDVRENGNISVVFGCGGDRDKLKRPLMGNIACNLAEKVWVTSDNPRTEDPIAIIEEIKNGLTKSNGVKIIVDRREAIRQAVEDAKTGDILIIAGRGDETHQIVADPESPKKTKLVPLDDREVVSTYFAEREKTQLTSEK